MLNRNIISRELEVEIVEAYRFKEMAIREIARRLHLRLGWPVETARYRVKNVLEFNNIEIITNPNKKT